MNPRDGTWVKAAWRGARTGVKWWTLIFGPICFFGFSVGLGSVIYLLARDREVGSRDWMSIVIPIATYLAGAYQVGLIGAITLGAVHYVRFGAGDGRE